MAITGVVRALSLEADCQGVAVHRLGLGILSLAFEGRGQVVVDSGGVCVFLAQDVPTDREALLEKECGLGILAARIELNCPGDRSSVLHIAIPGFLGQAGESLVGFQVQAGVAGLPMLIAPGAFQELEFLPGRQDGLGNLAHADALVDRDVKLLDALRQVGVRRGRAPGWSFLAVNRGRCRPRKDAQGKAHQGDRERSGGRPPHGAPRLGVRIGSLLHDFLITLHRKCHRAHQDHTG